MLKIVSDTIEQMKKAHANIVEWKMNGERHEFDIKVPEWLTNEWRFVRKPNQPNCALWRGVTYNILCKALLPKEQWFIPTGCQDCYKVVAKPTTYQGLLGVESVLLEYDQKGKCGVESRHYARGLYGGYWYNRSLEEALDRYETLRKIIPADVSLFVKRACTEFELVHGPSDKWYVTDKQLEIEADVEKYIWTDPDIPPQTDEAIEEVHKVWMRFAWKWDKTYRGIDAYNGYVKYCGK